MKKNFIITAILLGYIAVFIILFIKLRSLSEEVLEELSENNIYYLLGVMFIAGLAASMYAILEASNKKAASWMEEKQDAFSFGTNTVTGSDNTSNQTTSAELEKIKHELAGAIRQGATVNEKLDNVLRKINRHFEVSQGLVYVKEAGSGQLVLQASYAFVNTESDPRNLVQGEGLTGQAVKDQKPYFIKDIPEGYLKVISGLGESLPKSLLIIPCVADGEVRTVFELSSLQEYSGQTSDKIVAVCNYVSELINQ